MAGVVTTVEVVGSHRTLFYDAFGMPTAGFGLRSPIFVGAATAFSSAIAVRNPLPLRHFGRRTPHQPSTQQERPHA